MSSIRKIFVVLAVLLSALLPHVAQAQVSGYTHWSSPRAEPYVLGDTEALKVLKPIVEKQLRGEGLGETEIQGLLQRLESSVLTTPPVMETLEEVPPQLDGTHLGAMTFGRGKVLTNLIVTNDDLRSRGWYNKSREMKVWRVSGSTSRGQIIIIEYNWHLVCNNRSIVVKHAMGMCIIVRGSECDADCQDLRRKVSAR